MSRKKNYFVSDLHLFARRSQGHHHEEAIYEAAESAESFVLGGDIFDFAWTTRDSIEQSVDDATAWLERLVEHAPGCQFHFVVGNHDYHGKFMQRLEQLSQATPNFNWHEFFMREGDRMFLHGDVADGSACPKSLAMERSRWLTKEKKPAVLHKAYDWAINARLHRVAGAVAYPKRKVAKRIISYLGHVGHGLESGLKHVYFGHTHNHLCHYQYGGLYFHNPGAPLRGLKFRIVEVAA